QRRTARNRRRRGSRLRGAHRDQSARRQRDFAVRHDLTRARPASGEGTPMFRNTRLVVLALAAASTLAAGFVAAQSNDDFERRVREVHAAALPLDAHVDVLMPTTPGIYRTADGEAQITVDKLVAGGMATVTLAIQSPTGADTPEAIAKA